jgi:hypothetical protein
VSRRQTYELLWPTLLTGRPALVFRGRKDDIAGLGRHIPGAKLACHNPTVFQKWDVNTIFPGPDGQPMPVEYTLHHSQPHRLSVIDIDARDMQLAVYVDGLLRGQTSDFELNKEVDCGEDIKTCLHMNYSGGVVVVPPGQHTVRIAWAGKGQCSRFLVIKQSFLGLTR